MTEELLQAEFCELLGVDAARVGVRSSFFALGGHSIAAARLAARCGVLFNVQLPLPMVFAHPRLGELAAVLDSLRGEGGTNPEEKESAEIEEDARLKTPPREAMSRSASHMETESSEHRR